jgi:alpha-galactosidase
MAINSIRKLSPLLAVALLLSTCGTSAGSAPSDSGGTSGDATADERSGDRSIGNGATWMDVADENPGGDATIEGPDDSGLPFTIAKPPMGWNSWNKFGCENVNETVVREIADALVESGLASFGYDTVTTDDCWSAATRDYAGNLQAHAVKFPGGMKALGDYIHERGLKFGIYVAIGATTCTGGTPGSLDNEDRDAMTFAAWGVDYVKADRCNADGLVLRELFGRWREAIAATGRPMVLSASDNGGREEPWAWGPVTATQWRTTRDIRDNWERMLTMFDDNAKHAAATAPGAYNDPDMLEIGNGGMSDVEYRTHMSLWALSAAPLIAGNDIRNMSESTKAMLTSREVLVLDHDPLALQAIKAQDDGAGREVWYKPIQARGGRAVGLLNRSEVAATISVRLDDIGLVDGSATVRDLWERTDLGSFFSTYQVNVPAHGTVLLHIVGSDPTLVTGYLSDQTWTYSANEWGPVERDMSNGQSGASDGRALTIRGKTYTKGVGVHAPAAVEFRTNGSCSRLGAEIGIDDEVGGEGSAVFQVWADGRRIYDSGVLTGASAAVAIDVSIVGATSVRLQTVAYETTLSDHADWADARVTCSR